VVRASDPRAGLVPENPLYDQFGHVQAGWGCCSEALNSTPNPVVTRFLRLRLRLGLGLNMARLSRFQGAGWLRRLWFGLRDRDAEGQR
jgi:hypothetical protein